MTRPRVEATRPRRSGFRPAAFGTLLAAAIAYAAWVSSQQSTATVAAPSAPVEARLAETPQAEPDAVERTTPSGSSIPARAQKAEADTVIPDEDKLMQRLQLLRETSPAEAIALSRRIEEYFPDSPRAAERTYVSVRSLVEIKRFHEAREEAKAMVERFPGDPRTLEVKRHLLVHPLGHPSREELEATLHAAPPP
jgi:hypothetical protein